MERNAENDRLYQEIYSKYDGRFGDLVEEHVKLMEILEKCLKKDKKIKTFC